MGLVSQRSYEDLLGDALESLLKDGARTLQEFVDGLNAMNMRGPSGQIWKPELLEAELSRLGS
jgi:hypothetical protein